MSHNHIKEIASPNGKGSPFKELRKLHDLHLGHNLISEIDHQNFDGLTNLKVLDLSHNAIEKIHDYAFQKLEKLEDLNLGVNQFSEFPSGGLENLVHIKVHNNPSLQDFPSHQRFPKIKTLILSYAYHCCSFLASILFFIRFCIRAVGFGDNL